MTSLSNKEIGSPSLSNAKKQKVSLILCVVVIISLSLGVNILEFTPTLRTHLGSISLKTEDHHTKYSANDSNNNISDNGNGNSNSNSNSNNNSNAATHAYELQSKINNYTWETNTSPRWIPPKDVPELLPIDIRHIFLSENTAWIGDSTARQDYYTMYHVMNTSDEDETKKTLDLPTQNLNDHINRGKNQTQYAFYCDARRRREVLDGKWNDKVAQQWMELAQVKGSDTNCSATAIPEINQTQTWAHNNNGKGKFDFKAPVCFKHQLSFVKKHRDFLRRSYSVLIVTGGIWEVVKDDGICEMKIELQGHEQNNNTTVSQIIPSNEVLTNLLNALSELSGPSFFVVFMTFGPSAGQKHQENNQLYKELNGVTRDWFAATKPPHMDIVDFDKAIEERAWGQHRIHGDLDPHWGLEARLLSIQMVSDVVQRKQIRAASNGN